MFEVPHSVVIVSIFLDADTLDRHLVPCLLPVDKQGLRVGLLYCFGDRSLVKVEI